MNMILEKSIVFVTISLLFQGVPLLTSCTDKYISRETYTPAPSSTERKAVLDALRLWVKSQHHIDVVFVVRQLEIKNDCARVHVLLQSQDGSSRYEDITAQLKKENNRWKVVEIYCPEQDGLK